MNKKNIILTVLPLFWPKMPYLGIGFLQSYLKKFQIDSKIFDLNNYFFNLVDADLQKQWMVSCNIDLERNILSFIKDKFINEYKNIIKEFSAADFLSFSCFKSNFCSTLDFIKEVKDINPKVKIIVGGPEITRQYFIGGKDIFKKWQTIIDHFVVGEGEKPILNFMQGKNQDFISIFDELESLTELDYPNFLGCEIKNYPSKNALPISFSRGCIRKCNFCSERLLYKGYRNRAVENLIAEIEFHKENNNIKYFVFFDSLINANLKLLEKFCDLIIDRFGSINWEAQIAVRNDMPQDLLRKMKASGCYNLFVGLESGSDNILTKMNKGFTTDDAKNFFIQLKQANLFFGVSIIVGFPEESEADFKDSLDFIVANKELIPKIEQVNPFTYYDGTLTDKSWDYKQTNVGMKRMDLFLEVIKKEGFKYTNAFIGNLIEKNAGNSRS